MKLNAVKYLERADYTWSNDSIRFINTPTPTAKQSFFYVQEVGYFKTSPPYFTERANLNSFLIIYTLRGKGYLRYWGKNHSILPGQIFFINCMEHHYYECLQGQDWEFLWLHFNGATALGYYEEFIKSGFQVQTESDPNMVEHTMRQIPTLTQNKDLNSEILVSGLIMQLLTQLLIENSSMNMGLGFMPSYIKSTIKTIDHKFYEALSLDQIAGEIGISKYHLSREFKRYLGSTINEYLITTRLTHAKELLRFSQKSVESISYECGFGSASHFINMFKKHEQTTPLQYRKEWK